MNNPRVYVPRVFVAMAVGLICMSHVDAFLVTKSRQLGWTSSVAHSHDRLSSVTLHARKRRSRARTGTGPENGNVEVEDTPSANGVNTEQSEREKTEEKDSTTLFASTTLPAAPPAKEAKKAPASSGTRQDGSSSLEDLFGLGNEQLRELMEQELPVPREDLVTGKEVKAENVDENKVFQLPDLGEFIKETGGFGGGNDAGSGGESDRVRRLRSLEQMSGANSRETRTKSGADGSTRTSTTTTAGGGGGVDGIEDTQQKIDRKNREEYLRVLQLNPFADADESMFLDEYDIIPSIFGSGKLLSIPVPYLQTGHSILLVISLLAAFVYAPGNPLTEFPPEIRSFLKTSLQLVYSINLVLAVQAFFVAKEKNLPGTFWALKCFLLGGVAFYEVKEAKDPFDIKSGYSMSNKPWDRKSKSSRK